MLLNKLFFVLAMILTTAAVRSNNAEAPPAENDIEFTLSSCEVGALVHIPGLLPNPPIVAIAPST